MHLKMKDYLPHAYSTDRTQPNTRVNPERTRGSLPGFALRSLLKILRSFWVRSGSALCSLWVRYLGALYTLMREADPTFILPPVSPARCIFQTFDYYYCNPQFRQ
jgi:hypothetical protein